MIARAFLLVLLSPLSANAVGGISASKVVTPNAHPVPKGVLELEPYFAVSSSTATFDENWRRHNDTSSVTEMGFRFTAGLSDSVEIGMMLPLLMPRPTARSASLATDLGDIPVGLKWRFFSGDVVSLALQSGVTAPTGSTKPAQLATGDGFVTFEGGLIASLQLSERFSIDADVVTAAGIAAYGEPHQWGVAIDIAAGYQWPHLQPVLELSYAAGANGEAHLLSLITGITYNLNDRVILVTGVQYDLLGRLESSNITYSLAVTTSI